MQALMRPPPGATSLQNCAISGLHALTAACAPGPICAIAPDVENNKTAPVARTFLNIIYLHFLRLNSRIAHRVARLSPRRWPVEGGRIVVVALCRGPRPLQRCAPVEDTAAPDLKGASRPLHGKCSGARRSPRAGYTIAGVSGYRASDPVRPGSDQAVPYCSPLTGWAAKPVAASRPSGLVAAASSYLIEGGRVLPGSADWP